VQDGFAEIHITQEPVHGIGQTPVRCRSEKAIRHREKMPCRRHREIFLALEVIATLGQSIK
jgi:hypothetical protein